MILQQGTHHVPGVPAFPDGWEAVVADSEEYKAKQEREGLQLIQ